jgi:hypothetical protein
VEQQLRSNLEKRKEELNDKLESFHLDEQTMDLEQRRRELANVNLSIQKLSDRLVGMQQLDMCGTPSTSGLLSVW